MKAVIKFKDGKDGWEIRDILRKDPKKDEVEIEVKYVGICGSEVHLYHDRHYYEPPVVVGHEFSGVISRIGNDVNDWKVGDRVVCENRKTVCRKCEYCREGLMQLCPNIRAIGYVEDGYWTNYVCSPDWVLHRIPENVTLEEAALTEPTAVVVQAIIEDTPIRACDIVLIQGCGTIGLLAAMTAKAAGATVIITGIDVDKKVRLPIAKKLNIDYVFDITSIDLKSKIKEITNGKGVDFIVEASG